MTVGADHRVNIQWDYRSGFARNVNTFERIIELVDGTGNNQVDAVWQNVFAIGDSDSVSLNLSSLSRPWLWYTLTSSFTKIKSLYLKNETTDESVILTNNVVSGHTNMFSGATVQIEIPSGCSFVNVAPLGGWACGAGQNILVLENPGSTPLTVRAAILGVA